MQPRPIAGALLAACCSLAACGEGAPPAVSVGPVSFSEDRLLGLSEERRGTLANLAAFGLAVADSSTEALGAPIVEEWLDERLVEILAAELTLEKHAVDDAVLEAHYLTDPAWELTVRHILFFSERWRSREHRAEAEAKARRALELLRGGADFAETAARLSEEPGAEGRQGLLTPGREGSWVDEFWAAALALAAGRISPVTETQYGYHILRLEDREVVPFTEARSVVAREIANRIEDPSDVLDAWLDESMETGAGERHAIAVREARGRALAVPEGERAELERAWQDRVQRWAAALGLSYGLGPDGVAEAAMAALANPAQGAEIARNELDEIRSVLRARYRVTFAGGRP